MNVSRTGNYPSGRYERLIEVVRLFTPRVGVPKGVYRFKTFEEADEWEERHITTALAKNYVIHQKKFRQLDGSTGVEISANPKERQRQDS